jgi:hypothetical protein
MPTRTRSHPARRPVASADEEVEERGPSPLPLVLSVIALVAAGLALAWSTVLGGGGTATDCQARAWDSLPTEEALPAGWSIDTTSYFSNNLSVTLAGPPATDESSEGAIYATVTCYGRDGDEALARSRAGDSGSPSGTSDLTGIGDTGYTVGDELSGLSAIHFRRGDLVAYIVVAGTVTSEELRTTAQAFDQAIQSAKAGDIPSPRPPASAAIESFEPEPSVDVSAEPPASEAPGAAPELEALLPSEIDGTAFITDSASGADILQDDPGSRAMTAALRALGKTPTDLEVAQAYDENDEIDLYFVAFSLAGADPEAFRTLILQSWLVSDAEGVTIEEVELGGKMLTRVDYGDELADAYLYATGDAVILLHTSSAELAEAGAAALP